MTTKHALTMMAAPLALLASPAEAAYVDFTLTGLDLNATFRIDADNFSPPVESGDDFFVVENIAGTFGGVARTADSVTFNTTSFDGGLTIQLGSAFFGFLGAQLFDGSTTAPRFRNGSFTLANDTTGRTATLNVAAVPEPATWAMMLAGFGAAGVVMRRRTTVGMSHA